MGLLTKSLPPKTRLLSREHNSLALREFGVQGTGVQGTESVRSVRVRNHDPRVEKKCIKCRKWHPRERFGDHETSSDGKQSICFDCKNARGKERRQRDVRARLRHHTSTRVLTQLGVHAPEGITAHLEEYLGYRFGVLVRALQQRLNETFPGRKLRDVLAEGWHVDHIHPLSRYPVITERGVDWEVFRQCWHYDNLSCIPAEDNLKKGARVETEGSVQGNTIPLDDPFGIDDEEDDDV